MSTGVWGIPLSVPASYRSVEVQKDDNGTSPSVVERVNVGDSSGRIYFRTDHRGPGAPRFYDATFVFNTDNSVEMGALPYASLKALFTQVPGYTGSPVSIETEPGLWAPALFQDLVVYVNWEGRAKIYARFQQVSIQRDYYAESDEKPKQRVYRVDAVPWEIPWQDVDSRVLPRSKAFTAVTENIWNQNLFVAAQDETPVPVLVLGFSTIPAGTSHPEEQMAYVVERRRIEMYAAQVPVVYEIPMALLRTTTSASQSTAWVRASRGANYATPVWLSDFDLQLNLTGRAPQKAQDVLDLVRKSLVERLGKTHRMLTPSLDDCQSSVVNAGAA